MKKPLILLLNILVANAIFGQNLIFDFSPEYSLPLKEQKLLAAHTLVDLNADFPQNWITDYKSVEIVTNIDGKELKATGKNSDLNEQQLALITNTKIGGKINLSIAYNAKNSVTGADEIRNSVFSLKIIPDKEARFVGGQQQLKNYLHENIIAKLTGIDESKFQPKTIVFTINENGEVENSHLSNKNIDPLFDQMILKAIKNMPTWEPAQNAKGEKVKQTFQYTLSNQGC
jgi:hypothetical protein